MSEFTELAVKHAEQAEQIVGSLKGKSPELASAHATLALYYLLLDEQRRLL